MPVGDTAEPDFGAPRRERLSSLKAPFTVPWPLPRLFQMSSENASLELIRSLDSIVGSEYGADPVSNSFKSRRLAILNPLCRSAGTGAIFSRMLWALAPPSLSNSS